MLELGELHEEEESAVSSGRGWRVEKEEAHLDVGLARRLALALGRSLLGRCGRVVLLSSRGERSREASARERCVSRVGQHEQAHLVARGELVGVDLLEGRGLLLALGGGRGCGSLGFGRGFGLCGGGGLLGSRGLVRRGEGQSAVVFRLSVSA